MQMQQALDRVEPEFSGPHPWQIQPWARLVRRAMRHRAYTRWVDSLGRSQVERVRARYRIPREDAEDLMQQTLLAFLQKRDGIDCPDAWLLGAYRRECLMYLRRRQRRLYDVLDDAHFLAVERLNHAGDQLFLAKLRRGRLAGDRRDAVLCRLGRDGGGGDAGL